MRGDRAALAAMYRHHHPRLTRFLLRFTSRRDLIDDVVNDTFWIVWRRATDFRGDARVATWVTGIAYRCLLKALRDRVHGEEVGESSLEGLSLEALGGAAPPAGAALELHDWLSQGLRTLPATQRMTLELAYFMGETCESIAAIMGCPVGTVKARLFHARMRLRNVLPVLAGHPAQPGTAGTTE